MMNSSFVATCRSLPFLCCLLFLMGSSSSGVAQDAAPDAAWQHIAPLFTPPPEFAGKLGQYRSPLIFADGRKVQSADQWPARRKELLSAWTEIMGPWPEVIESPRVDVLSEEKREGITQRRVRVEIAPQQTGEGWLLIPPHKQGQKLPAVLVVFYEPETSVGLKADAPDRDFGWQLAQRGFVTLNIGTPGGDAWRPDIGKADCQPLSFHAYVAANCWQALAHMSEVDSDRIGIVGHSYGGKWSMFGGALWDKFAAVAVSDPGIVFDETRSNVNYWEPWYLGLDPSVAKRKPGIPPPDNPAAGAYVELRRKGHDLHELHALICPRPFFVSGGSEDPPERWIALNHSMAVNDLLGYQQRVGMSNRPKHSPTPESNAILCDFFVHFLGAKSADNAK